MASGTFARASSVANWERSPWKPNFLPIESTFGTVRQRHRRTKGSGTRAASLAMLQAEKPWRKLDGAAPLPLLLAGRAFRDGELQAAA